jgi:NitT/TauT family transport system substrate-binding protein
MPPFLTRSHVLALLAAAPAAAVPVRTTAQPAPAIRIGSSTSGDGYSEPFYGAEFGFWKNAGLNVEMVDLPNTGAIAAAVAGRAIDVGFADLVTIGNAVNHGVPWVVIGGGALYSGDAPATILCVAKDSAIRTAKDLEGRAIGVVALASISSLGVRAWLESNGADLTKIKLYELSYPTMVPALNRGDIAAAFIAEPVLTGVKKDVRLLSNAFDAVAKSFLISTCFTTRARVTENPALTKRLVQALDEIARWANTHHDDTAVVLSKGSRIPLEVVRTMTRVRYGNLETRLVQPVLDVAAKYKAIEKPLNAADLIVKPS